VVDTVLEHMIQLALEVQEVQEEVGQELVRRAVRGQLVLGIHLLQVRHKEAMVAQALLHLQLLGRAVVEVLPQLVEVERAVQEETVALARPQVFLAHP
jgi:hypothetical protein